MPIPILMPALSPTMTEGNIATWLKKEGEKVFPGDVIAEVETDKATMEVEAIDEGILSKIIFTDGSENIAVNKLIGVIIQDGEEENEVSSFIKNFDLSSPSNDTKETEKKEGNSLVTDNLDNNDEDVSHKTKDISENKEPPISNTTIKRINSKDNARILISPLAKRIASLKNIDIENISGTGPNGRIVKKDLNSFLSNQIQEKNFNSSENFSEKVPLTNIRKTIGKRLQQSKQTVPHFYLKSTINIDSLECARNEINLFTQKNQYSIPKVSLNDLLIKALAVSLEKVPELNATWNEDSIIYYKNVDISVAVATQEGLFTPVIKNACKKKVSEISSEMKSLIEKAKNKKLLPQEYIGGSFSISNLGMFEVDEFSAIINPPQAGILAVGGIKEQLKKNDNQIIVEKTITFTLSVDHRIADGAIASNLLKNLKFVLHNPIGMIV